MKKQLRRLMVMGAMLLTAMIFSGITAAAEDQFLFNILIKDSTAKYTVPVYESVGTAVTVGPAADKSTVVTDCVSTTAKVRIRKKSDYFKANYQKVALKKTITLTDSQQLRFVVKKYDGTKKSFKITVRRPVEPAITSVILSSTTTFMLRSGGLSIALDGPIEQEVTGLFKIYNSKKKLVYKSKPVKADYGPMSLDSWDGCASSGNTAGLKKGELVPEGSYTIKAYMKYTYGGVKKTVSKNVTILVEDPQINEDGEQTSSVPVFDKVWPWVVVVTGDRKVDYLAELICQRVLKPGMTEFQRVKALYKWCEMHFTREGGSRWPSTTAWKFDLSSTAARNAITEYRRKVLRMIRKGTAVVNTVDHTNPNGGAASWWINKRLRGMGKLIGNCTDMAAMFECLCRHAGLECDIIENSLSTSNPLHHLWNVVKVDGNWYHCDPEVEMLRLYGRTTPRYTMFLRGKCLGDKEKRYGKINKRYKDLYKLISPTDYNKK